MTHGDDAKIQSTDALLTKEEAQRIVAEGARRYFESRRARVDEFVDRHFSLSGSLSMHRKAIGWDMLKVPANIALAVPQIATKLAAAGAKAMGADRASAYLASRKLVFETEVGNEIEWLVITDLLELPFRQCGNRTRIQTGRVDIEMEAERVERHCPTSRGAGRS